MGKKRQRSDDNDDDDDCVESGQSKLAVKKQNAGKKKKKSETFEQKLARSDPEFLEFLKGEKSDLLKFDDGELSADSEGDEPQQEHMDTSDTGSAKKKKKKPNDSSKSVESESDSDNDEEPSEDMASHSKKSLTKKTSVTLKMVDHWTKRLKNKGSLPVMSDLIEAFKAAVEQVGNSEDATSKFKVVGSEVFNAVIQACLQELLPFLLQHLNLPVSKDPNKPVLPSTSSKWKQVRLNVKSYIGDVVTLLSSVGSVEVVRALLKHTLDLMIFSVGFPKLSKKLLKKLIEVWSSCGDEKNTLLAFCAIHRLLRLSRDGLFDVGFKLMYTAYVRNTKFTSQNTLSTIQVMQRTLVEVAQLNVEVTYKYAFTYIRQLAIHLRSAMAAKKKETIQIVYNWQYIHSLALWTRLICELNSDEYIHSLLYPLTQIIIGTMKLVPTAQYYPLRFICVRLLNKLSAQTSTFIPVLPFLTEVLNQLDFRRPVQGSKMQSYNFQCILKLSKSELRNKSFRDGVIDQVHELMFDNLYIYAHTVGFPELCLPAVIELRKFLKSCKVPSYTRSIKELLGKITETSTALTERRRTATLNLRDAAAVAAWEAKSRETGTPLGKYYVIWRKLRDQQMQTEHSQSTEPQQLQHNNKKQKRSRKGDSDSSDFDDEELELLARSGSENEDSESESDVNNDTGSESESSERESNKKTDQRRNGSVVENKLSVKPAKSGKSKVDKEPKVKVDEKITRDSSDDEEDDAVEDISLSESDDDGVVNDDDAADSEDEEDSENDVEMDDDDDDDDDDD